jgi:hypothetical protein
VGEVAFCRLKRRSFHGGACGSGGGWSRINIKVKKQAGRSARSTLAGRRCAPLTGEGGCLYMSCGGAGETDAAGRMGENSLRQERDYSRAGILRLRVPLASPMSHSAQDDNFGRVRVCG